MRNFCPRDGERLRKQAGLLVCPKCGYSPNTTMYGAEDHYKPSLRPDDESHVSVSTRNTTRGRP